MATRSLGTLTLDLVMKLGGFKQGADKAQREFDKFSREMQSRASRLGSAIKGVGATLIGGFAFGSLVQNAMKFENAMTQLEAVLKSTNSAAGVTAKQLEEAARGYQRITVFADDAVIAAQAVLLTFTRIRGGQFAQATEQVLNLSTALKTDLQSSALLIGKALNDPVRGITALTRSGIQFTAEQKKLIKSFIEMGDVAGAQTIILKELEVQFGGSAEAARNTLGGAIEGLKHALGEILEPRSGLPGAAAQLNAMTEMLYENARAGTVDTIADGFLNLGRTALSALAPILDTFARLITSASDLGSRLDRMNFLGLGNEDAILPPEVERRLFTVAGQIEELIVRRDRLLTKPMYGGFFNEANFLELKWVEFRLERLLVLQNQLGTGRGPSTRSATGPTSQRVVNRAVTATPADLEDISAIAEKNKTALEKYNEELANLEELRKKLGTQGEPILDDETYNRERARLKAVLDKETSKGSSATSSVEKETDQAAKKIQEFTERLEEQRATLTLTEPELLRYSITNGGIADALAKMGAQAGPLREKLLALADATSADKAKADIEEQITALRDQATQLSLTEEQAFAYSVTQGELSEQLALTGADAERLTQALLDANNALADARKALEQQAQRESIFEATRTDAERYAATMQELNTLFGGSAADQDTYGRAVADAVGEYITASNAVTEYRLRMEELNRLLAEGTLTQEAFEAAVATVDETFAEAGREAAKAFADQARRNTQDILANFLEDPFSRGIDGLIEDFDQMFRRIAAQAVAARIAEKLFDGFDDWLTQASQMLKQFFASIAASNSSGGFLSALGSAFGSAFGGGGGMSGLGEIAVTAQRIPGYAEGGFTGTGGVLEPAGVVHRGEYVVSADRVRQPGVRPLLDSLQKGSPQRMLEHLRTLELKLPRFSQGGLVGSVIPATVAATSAAQTEALSPRSFAQNITQQFSISAPRGTVSAATQQQIAAAAARGLAQANRRNN